MFWEELLLSLSTLTGNCWVSDSTILVGQTTVTKSQDPSWPRRARFCGSSRRWPSFTRRPGTLPGELLPPCSGAMNTCSIRHRLSLLSDKPNNLVFQEERLQHHTRNVARTHYNVGLHNKKPTAVGWMADCSGDTLDAEGVQDYVAERRKKEDEEDRASAAEAARELLKSRSKRSNPAVRRTRQWNLTLIERETFQAVLNDCDSRESCAAIFELEAGHLFPEQEQGVKKFPRGKQNLYRYPR